MTKRNTYTKDFKLEAVRLLETGDQDGAPLARDLGISHNQLYKWQKEINEKGADAFQGSSRKPALQEGELTRLKRENARLQEENDILKKGRDVLCWGVEVKYAFIRNHAADHPVTLLCQTLGVSRSGYYD
jgi:transposase